MICLTAFGLCFLGYVSVFRAGGYSLRGRMRVCYQVIYIYIYIAEVLKTRSNLAAKFKLQLLPLAAVGLTVSFKFLGGAASWLVACKSNKYEVLVHSQNKSLDLSMGG